MPISPKSGCSSIIVAHPGEPARLEVGDDQVRVGDHVRIAGRGGDPVVQSASGTRSPAAGSAGGTDRGSPPASCGRRDRTRCRRSSAGTARGCAASSASTVATRWSSRLCVSMMMSVAASAIVGKRSLAAGSTPLTHRAVRSRSDALASPAMCAAASSFSPSTSRPTGGAGVHRSVGTVRYLADHGYEPVVVTGPGSRVDRWSPSDPGAARPDPGGRRGRTGSTGAEPRASTGLEARGARRAAACRRRGCRGGSTARSEPAPRVGAGADLMLASGNPY